MSFVLQVRGSAYLPFAEFLEDVGAPIGGASAEALLPAMVLRDPEAPIPIHLAHAFLDRSARTVGRADLGFLVGRHMRVDSLGTFGRSVMRSLTLHEALGKIRTKFCFYSSAEHIWWMQRGEDVYLFHAYTARTGPGSRIARQCVLLLLRDLVRVAAGPTWQPVQVLSPEAIREAKAMMSVFPGARIRQSQFAGIVFPATLLSLPWEPPATPCDDIQDSDDTAFEASGPANDLAGSVKQVISMLLRYGGCNLDQTAEAVGMHRRTLQRRLAEAGADYSDLLSEVRFQQALQLIEDPAARIIDVAGELGYSDSANFTRAFRQWTGVSPTDFRRSHEEALSRNDRTGGKRLM